jgi:hypothetical protein
MKPLSGDYSSSLSGLCVENPRIPVRRFPAQADATAAWGVPRLCVMHRRQAHRLHLRRRYCNAGCSQEDRSQSRDQPNSSQCDYSLHAAPPHQRGALLRTLKAVYRVRRGGASAKEVVRGLAKWAVLGHLTAPTPPTSPRTRGAVPPITRDAVAIAEARGGVPETRGAPQEGVVTVATPCPSPDASVGRQACAGPENLPFDRRYGMCSHLAIITILIIRDNGWNVNALAMTDGTASQQPCTAVAKSIDKPRGLSLRAQRSNPLLGSVRLPRPSTASQ